MAFFFLLLYLVFVFIRPQEFWEPLIGVPMVKISLIALAVFVFFEKSRRFDAPQNLLLVFLLIIVVLSGVTNGWAGGGIASAEKLLTTMLLPFLLIQNVINTYKRQQIVLLLLIFSAIVMVSDGVAQKESLAGIGWSGAGLSQGTRITYLGIFNDPNDLAMFLAMILPCIVYIYQSAKGFFKSVFLAALGYISYGIYLTNSRGGLLAVMSMVGVWFYLKYGAVKSFVLGALAAPVAFFILSKFRTIDPNESSASGRLDAWYEGMQMFLSRPFFGVGMGQFTDYHHLTAHNSFVLVFSELGAVGYYLWVGFLVCCIVMLLSLWSEKFKLKLVKEIDSKERKLALFFTYTMIAYLVSCFFLSRAYTPMLYVFCGMYVATFYRSIGFSVNKNNVMISYKNFSPFVWKFVFGSLATVYLTTKLFI